MTLLVLDDVSVVYHRRDQPDVGAVVDVSLRVGAGEIVGLVGESGCGKSTLAQAAVGLLPASSGEITFEGRPVEPLGATARRRGLLGLQMVFQDPNTSLNPRRTVGAQLRDGFRQTGELDAADRVIPDLLESVGLPTDTAARYPHEFSGGQRQRIAIARALSVTPSLIFADEPTSSLDASIQAQITNLLRDLSEQRGVSVVLISHDLALVRHVADRIAVMYLGKIVETGSADSIWQDPQHPYTQALIASVPSPDHIGSLPDVTPGQVPDPADPPVGCRFRPRCQHAFDRCLEEPPMLPTETGSRAACWLHAEAAEPPAEG